MSGALLDVNVLVALAWPNHVHHWAASRWFNDAHTAGWATCPVTESGFIRVSSNRRVIPDARSPREAAEVCRQMTQIQGHVFWSDDVAIASAPEVDFDRVQGYRQVTDVHLLALAARNGGRLVSFDSALANLSIAEVTVLTLDG
ncbi:type II toxin-antitoxin system VapC family toxin [soil metagenome]